MRIKEIQNLIKFVAKSGASEVSIEMEKIKLTIKAGSTGTKAEIQKPAAVLTPSPAPPPVVVEQTPESISPKEASAKTEDSKYIEVRSPIIGTFYRKPSPDKPAFVEMGDKISEGSVVCVIEAMKLFNEIESEVSGTIVKVLVEDSTPVEFDQPLFLVDPS